jgi:hypothetical protein
MVSNHIEIIWRSKKSRGPDVEMILPLPFTVAIESKNTVAEALDDFGQIIRYIESKKYDSVIIKILEFNDRQDDSEKYKTLQELADRFKVGILIGEDPYAPLMGNEKVLKKSGLSLYSDPAELLKSMGSQVLKRYVPLDNLISFRGLFEV